MFRKASVNGKIPSDTRLTSQKEKGAQSLSVSTVDGWIVGEEQDFIICVVDSDGSVVAGSATSWKGVPASNGTIANLTITGGVDRLYPIGAVVIPTATSAWANDLISGLLKSHNTDGTIKESALPKFNPQNIPSKAITADKIDFTTIHRPYIIKTTDSLTGQVIHGGGNQYVGKFTKIVHQSGNIGTTTNGILIKEPGLYSIHVYATFMDAANNDTYFRWEVETISGQTKKLGILEKISPGANWYGTQISADVVLEADDVVLAKFVNRSSGPTRLGQNNEETRVYQFAVSAVKIA